MPKENPKLREREPVLNVAGMRIKRDIDWQQYPHLAEIFEHRPTVNKYWLELTDLLLTFKVKS